MILVTGATGFIGSALIQNLIKNGYKVRALLQPSRKSPNLPHGMPMEVAVSSMWDERGMLAALKGIQVIFHLASAEKESVSADIESIDGDCTSVLVEAARQAGIQRLFFLSHIGADKNSFFPVFRAKALAESFIQESGVPFTIYRTSVVFGPGDNFTTYYLSALRSSPGLFFMPGDGNVNLQPLWIEDLINCLVMSLEERGMPNAAQIIGGGEYFSFREILKAIMTRVGIRRLLIPLAPSYMRTINLWIGQYKHDFPLSPFWLDYLAADCTCALDSLPRLCGILPGRFLNNLNYLKGGF